MILGVKTRSNLTLMKINILWIFIFTNTFILAQDIKPLDYKEVYKKQHIQSRDCYELKYKASQVIDSVLTGKETFNEKGQLIHFTESYMRGKKMADYRYEYDTQGKLSRNTISLVFNDWKEVEMKLTFDASGKVISRELPEAIPSFWVKETFTYNKAGIMTKSEQWYLVDGALKAMTSKEYPGSITPLDNSLTYIYDQQGLLIMHNKHDNGRVVSAKKYHYHKG